MKFLSLFSGIDACSVVWGPIGWEAVGFSEIEPFPCKVLAMRYPNTPNLGDVTKITEDQIKALGAIDVVVGGSPCQDLSVAGKRKGMINEDGTVTRSGLFYNQYNIFKWAQKHCGARFLLWENVPGAFSSRKGGDFASVVSLMAGLDNVETPDYGWGYEGVALGDNGLLEWCTLDAQYFGVAQRRRRVFALLDAGNWKNRPPILLERQSVRGDTAPSRSARENPTSATPNSVGALCASDYKGVGNQYVSEGKLIVQSTFWNGSQEAFSGDYRILHPVVDTVTGGGNVPIALAENIIGRQPHNGGNGEGFTEGGPMYTLNATGVHGVAHPVVLMDQGGSVMNVLEDGTVGTLRRETHGYEPCVIDRKSFAQNQLGEVREGDVFNTLNRNSNASGRNTPLLRQSMAVRRLTPIECERLQGFPDGYSDIKPKDKPTPDGPRYKALGNSMAVPVMQWIGCQIDRAVNHE